MGKVLCKRICVICGKEFIGSPNSKTCSEECRFKFTHPGKCVVCGQPTMKNTKTCCKECQKTWQSDNNSFRRPEVKAKIKETNLNRYGVENPMQNAEVHQKAMNTREGDEIVGLMTFGAPRYSTRAEVELLRLCFKEDVLVIGGVERLFKTVVEDYGITSIISYCDRSKFTGYVYNKLGFRLIHKGNPSRHWYNVKTKTHITDNLLRQRGFDQLLGNVYGCFGKDYTNDELMLSHDFVEIYDCGQDTYLWERN